MKNRELNYIATFRWINLQIPIKFKLFSICFLIRYLILMGMCTSDPLGQLTYNYGG